MFKKQDSPFLKFLYIFWSLFILAALYIYFFYPEIFYRAVDYPGPGSPFVNTPAE